MRLICHVDAVKKAEETIFSELDKNPVYMYVYIICVELIVPWAHQRLLSAMSALVFILCVKYSSSFVHDSYHSRLLWLIFLVLVSCDKFWIKFVASLVSTFNFGETPSWNEIALTWYILC